MDNVLTAIFNVESEGFQAFTEMKNSLAKELYFVPQMVLVKRKGNQLDTLESYESPALSDGKTFGGGLFGSLLGIIGGPVGMLLGGTTGALLGATAALDDSSKVNSLLDCVANKMLDGTVAIIALVREEDESPLNNILTKFDAVIIRRSAILVAEEVAEAERLEEEMRHQLKAQLRAEKKAELTEAFQQKCDKIKADFEAFKASFKRKG